MLRIVFRPALVALLLILSGDPALSQDDRVSSDRTPPGMDLAAELETQLALPVPTSSDPQEQCIHYHKRGMANSRLGRYEQSISDLRQALSLNQPGRLSQDNWCDRWRIQNDLSATLLRYGDLFGQIEHLKAAATELRQVNAKRYHHTQLFLIDPYVALGMLSEADEAFRRATDVLPEVKQRRDWAMDQYNVTYLYSAYAARLQELRGNKIEAEKLRRAALVNADQYLAVMIRTNGKESQLTRIAVENVKYATRNLAANLAAQGKLGEAEYLAQEALRLALSYSTFNTEEASRALSDLAFVKLQQGHIVSAFRYSQLATTALENAGVKTYSTSVASRRSQMGLILAMQGRWSESLQVFEARDVGLRASPEQYSKFGSHNIDWAMALLRTGQGSKATAMLKALLDHNLKKPFVDPVYVAYVRGYLGVALTEQRDNDLALSQFREAMPYLIRQTGNGAGDDGSGFLGVYRLRVIIEGYLELLSALHASRKQSAGTDLVAEAYKVADLARHSSVQRAVAASAARASLPDPRLAQLARREQDASNQLQALSKILIRLASTPERERLQKVIDEMQRDITELASDQIALRREIHDKFPDYADLIDPQPPTPEEVQRALLPDEAVITLYSGERKAFVWTITKSEVAFRSVQLSKEMLANDVPRILSGVDLGDGDINRFDVAASYKLYASLLAPDEAKWSGAKLINVIPHGALGQVPFAMLITGPFQKSGSKSDLPYSEMPWLIRRVAIAQQSSASGFVALRKGSHRKQEQNAFIGFGDPLFMADATPATQRAVKFRNLKVATTQDETLKMVEQAQQSEAPISTTDAEGRPTRARAFSLLAPLPDTADELKEIAQVTGAVPDRDLFLGTRATESNVKSSDLSRYRIVVFATHGLKPGELKGLDQPALALSNPTLVEDANNDGFLTLEEVLGLKLNAEWVVLSACNTASADGDGSEAVSGLGRGFFYAGARSLLVSNWAVETVSARMLTTGLFKQQASHPDMHRAEALRQSMLDVMQTKHTDYSHPVFWAPFSLVGDGLVQ